MLPRSLAVALGFASLFALASVGPASAVALISVEAEHSSGTQDFDQQADNNNDPSSSSVAVHGQATSDLFGTSAFVASGPTPGCDVEPLGFGCASAGGPGARVAGEVRGDLGLLRLRSFASSNVGSDIDAASALGTVELLDDLRTLSAGPVTFHLHFDGDLIEHPNGNNIANDVFELTLALSGASFVFPAYIFDTPDQQTSHFVVDQTFVLSDLAANSLITLDFSMFAQDACVSQLDPVNLQQCSVSLDASHTAYLGVEGDVVSLSGYTYLGFTPPTGVPEPGTASLVALGLVGLALRQLSRRENPSFPSNAGA